MILLLLMNLLKDQITEYSTLSVVWTQELATRLQVLVSLLVAPIVLTLPQLQK